jgi:hypothetical protein
VIAAKKRRVSFHQKMDDMDCLCCPDVRAFTTSVDKIMINTKSGALLPLSTLINQLSRRMTAQWDELQSLPRTRTGAVMAQLAISAAATVLLKKLSLLIFITKIHISQWKPFQMTHTNRDNTC